MFLDVRKFINNCLQEVGVYLFTMAIRINYPIVSFFIPFKYQGSSHNANVELVGKTKAYKFGLKLFCFALMGDVESEAVFHLWAQIYKVFCYALKR